MKISAVAIGGTGALCLYLWNTRRNESEREADLEIRPPAHLKLLRPAGHSLQRRLWELTEKQDREVSLTILGTLLAAVLAYPAVVFGAQFVGAPSGWKIPFYLVLLSIFSLVTAGACGWRAWKGANRIMKIRGQIRNHWFGLRGEQAVAEALHSPEVAGLGYFAFHDVPKEAGGNIDHVVVGPAGVFVIETKMARTSAPLPGAKRNRLKLHRRRIHFPSGRADDKPVLQLEQNVDQVKAWLTPLAPGVSIEALLVYPGWEVQMTDRTDLKAMSSHSLRHYFHKLPTKLTVQQLQAMYGFLEKKCRDVELGE